MARGRVRWIVSVAAVALALLASGDVAQAATDRCSRYEDVIGNQGIVPRGFVQTAMATMTSGLELLTFEGKGCTCQHWLHGDKKSTYFQCVKTDACKRFEAQFNTGKKPKGFSFTDEGFLVGGATSVTWSNIGQLCACTTTEPSQKRQDNEVANWNCRTAEYLRTYRKAR